MKALVIGAAGFVGNHLVRYLNNIKKWDVSVSKLPDENINIDGVNIYDLDIMDKGAVKDLFISIKPNYIFHLAAQSSVALSWKEPELTTDININGAINVLDALRDSAKDSRLLLIGSGEEYGKILAEENPIKECNLLRPGNIYAVSKVCQGMLGKIYADAYHLDIIIVRAFNHIGAGQAPIFVVSDFCKQVAEIEYGIRDAIIYVGNLSAKRDFTDVRDVVRAYSMLVEKGSAGEIYNVGSGISVSVETILNMILQISNTPIRIETDCKKFRPIDVSEIRADITKLINITGWKPEISLIDTIKETLNYWREKVLVTSKL